MSQDMFYPVNWAFPATWDDLRALRVSQWHFSGNGMDLYFAILLNIFTMEFISWSNELTWIKIMSDVLLTQSRITLVFMC